MDSRCRTRGPSAVVAPSTHLESCAKLLSLRLLWVDKASFHAAKLSHSGVPNFGFQACSEEKDRDGRLVFDRRPFSDQITCDLACPVLSLSLSLDPSLSIRRRFLWSVSLSCRLPRCSTSFDACLRSRCRPHPHSPSRRAAAVPAEPGTPRASSSLYCKTPFRVSVVPSGVTGAAIAPPPSRCPFARGRSSARTLFARRANLISELDLDLDRSLSLARRSDYRPTKSLVSSKDGQRFQVRPKSMYPTQLAHSGLKSDSSFPCSFAVFRSLSSCASSFNVSLFRVPGAHKNLLAFAALSDDLPLRPSVRRSRRPSSSLSCSVSSRASCTTRQPTQRRMPSNDSETTRKRRSSDGCECRFGQEPSSAS